MSTPRDLPKPFKRGEYYYFWYRAPDGKRQMLSTHSTTVKGAKAVMRKHFEKQARGRTEATFLEYAEPFFVWERCPRVKRLLNDTEETESASPISRKYVHDLRLNLNKWVLTDLIFPYLPIREITPGDVEDLKSRLLDRCPSRKRANVALKTVKVILSEAGHRHDISHNPAATVALPKATPKVRPLLTPPELRLLFHDALDADVEPLERIFFSTLIATGGRVGAVRALRWDVIDLQEGPLEFCRRVKNNKYRKIQLPSILLDRLRQWKLQRPEVYRKPDAHVFAAPWVDGQPPGATWVRKHWDRIVERATSLPEEKRLNLDGRRITPHALRKSLNHLLLEARVHDVAVIAYLGWSDMSTTHMTPAQKRHYTELRFLKTKEAAKAIDEALCPDHESGVAHTTGEAE